MDSKLVARMMVETWRPYHEEKQAPEESGTVFKLAKGEREYLFIERPGNRMIVGDCIMSKAAARKSWRALVGNGFQRVQ